MEELVDHLSVEQEFRKQDNTKESSAQDGKVHVMEHGESSKSPKGHNNKRRPRDKKKKGFQS